MIKLKKHYVITDGKRYIKQGMSGKHKLVENVAIADFWDSKNKAESVLYNSVPPYMRYSLFVCQIDGATIEPVTKAEKELVERREKVRSTCNNSYNLSKYSFDEDSEVQSLIKGFEDVRKILERVSDKQQIKQLDERTLYMDWVVEDIKHYHGRKSLNAYDEFKLGRLEDKAIIKRISAKNQLEIAQKIHKYCDEIMEHIVDICDTINDVKNRRYVPRALIDLFESDNLDIEF